MEHHTDWVNDIVLCNDSCNRKSAACERMRTEAYDAGSPQQQWKQIGR